MADTKVNIQHLGGQRYVGRNESGDQILIDADSPAIGVRPMEALLASLGTCIAFDVVEILAKRRTPVQSCRIELEGTRAEDHPRRYTHIKVRHIVGGERHHPEEPGAGRQPLAREILLRSGEFECGDCG